MADQRNRLDLDAAISLPRHANGNATARSSGAVCEWLHIAMDAAWSDS
jgi:hypothetical protein